MSNPTPIKEYILRVVTASHGIVASRLCAQLASDYLDYTKGFIRNTIIDMSIKGEIFEIEYILPNGKNESLFLPKGSSVRRLDF